MNFELAAMTLEGLGRSPITVGLGEAGVEIRGNREGLKDLARLLLLLAGEETDPGEELDLSPGIHLTTDAAPLRLMLQR